MPRCLMAKKWKTVAYEKEKEKLSSRVAYSDSTRCSQHSGTSPPPLISSKSSFLSDTPLTNGNDYIVIKSERLSDSPRPVITITSTFSLAKKHAGKEGKNNECNNNSNSNNLNHSSKELVSNHQSNKDDLNLSQSSDSHSTSSSTSGNKGTGNTPHNGNPWGPSSPTEGATAPSPPPSWLPAPTAGKVTVLFNGYLQDSPTTNRERSSCSPNSIQEETSNVTNMDGQNGAVSNGANQVVTTSAGNNTTNSHNKGHSHPTSVIRSTPRSSRYYHAHCLPPPKKRDIYRPYCLPESIAAVQQEKLRLQTVCSSLFERKPEDLTTAHAILDLSTSSPLLPPSATTVVLPPVPPLTPATPSNGSVIGSASSVHPPPLVNQSRSAAISLLHHQDHEHSANQQLSTEHHSHPLSTLNTNANTATGNGKRARQQKNKGMVSDSSGRKRADYVPPVNVPVPPVNTPASLPSPASNAATPAKSPAVPTSSSTTTIAYTYEAFFVSDGRSKRKLSNSNTTTASSPKENTSDPADSDSSTQNGAPKTRYTCSECGKNYATSSNLSRHKQTHRSLDSQAAKRCNVCGKAYVSMPALAMHILTHNLHHKCDVCGKAFSRPWLLQGHMRSHTGEKPYGCAHCGKAFADRSNLRAHMQTHSSAKNYSCKRCNKSFALKSYLNKHYDSACFKDGASQSDMEMEEGELLLGLGKDDSDDEQDEFHMEDETSRSSSNDSRSSHHHHHHNNDNKGNNNNDHHRHHHHLSTSNSPLIASANDSKTNNIRSNSSSSHQELTISGSNSGGGTAGVLSSPFSFSGSGSAEVKPTIPLSNNGLLAPEPSVEVIVEVATS